MIKRTGDLLACLTLMLILLPVMLVLAVAVQVTSKGPALYWSQRMGKDERLFSMPKFRTMRTDTPEVATHLLADGNSYLTPIGGFLRRTSLDELPQLFSVLTGDMSFVGPRPALHNQHDLMAMRRNAGVASLVPGITGWAQINGRDEIPLEQKVALEKEYLENRGPVMDIGILFKTAFKVLGARDISH